MGIYDTQVLRNYFNSAQGMIVDLGFLHETSFKEINLSNFRKYISRLAEEGLLYPISKGVYSVGKIDDDKLIETVCNHYIENGMGFAKGEYLLYQKGIINKIPENIELVSYGTMTNKNINQIYINKSSKPIGKATADFFELLQLAYFSTKAKGMLDEDEMLSLSSTLTAKALSYSEFMVSSNTELIKLFPRIYYTSLAILLDKLHISNEVMKIYEASVGGFSSK